MNEFVLKVKNFQNSVLYSNIPNEEKTIEYRKLLAECKQLNAILNINEKDYILSQLSEIGDIDQYTIPVVKSFIERFLLRYNTYYGIPTDSDILITDLDNLKLFEITPKYFPGKYYHGAISELESEQFKALTKWKGILFGINDRVLFCFPTLKKNKSFWCTYILDTGSKLNYISDETIVKLGVENAGAGGAITVSICGIKTSVYSGAEADRKLIGVNVLGFEFLKSFDCEFTLTVKDGEGVPFIIPTTLSQK